MGKRLGKSNNLKSTNKIEKIRTKLLVKIINKSKKRTSKYLFKIWHCFYKHNKLIIFRFKLFY